MIDSTRRHGSPVTRVLRLCGIALLLLAAGCGDTGPRDPNISADEERSSSGTLEALTVEGNDFTPNGPVLVTVVMAATGGTASPYIEETIQADAEGKIRYERRPVPCPQPADYQRGTWINVIARDMSQVSAGRIAWSPEGSRTAEVPDRTAPCPHRSSHPCSRSRSTTSASVANG